MLYMGLIGFSAQTASECRVAVNLSLPLYVGSQHVVTRNPLGLHTHLQCESVANNVPLAVRTHTRFFKFL